LKEEESEITIQNIRLRQISKDNAVFVYDYPTALCTRYICAIYICDYWIDDIYFTPQWTASEMNMSSAVNFNRFHSNDELVTFFRIQSFLAALIIEPLLKENMTLGDYCAKSVK